MDIANDAASNVTHTVDHVHRTGAGGSGDGGDGFFDAGHEMDSPAPPRCRCRG